MDVHAPHEPIHTWRDFLIHIATIVIGLLIAVGLEQSVDHFSDIPPDQTEALLHDTTATLIELSALRQIIQQLDQQYVTELKQ